MMITLGLQASALTVSPQVTPAPQHSTRRAARLPCAILTRSTARQPTCSVQPTPLQPLQPACVRTRVVCGFLPFGRNIFDTSQKQQQANDAHSHGDDAEHSAGASSPPALQQAAEINPYAVFVAVFVDRVGREPQNPAYQSLQTQRSGRLKVAISLWDCLEEPQKESFYELLSPLCDQLAAEASGAAASSPQTTPLTLLDRVEQYSEQLPARERAVLESLWEVAALQRLEQLTAAVVASQSGRDAPAAPRPASLAPASSPLAAVIAADQQDPYALRAALDAAGFTHLVLLTDDDGARSTTLATAAPSALAAGSHGESGGADVSAPDVRLVTRLRPQTKDEFWSGFVNKCRLAWDVFFPTRQQAMSSARASRARLQMILVSDRSGLDLPTLMRIRNQSLSAIAQSNGWDNLSELELQVAHTKGSGEQVKLAVPLSAIPHPFMLRNADDYDYEYQDEDDWEEGLDDTKVGEIVEGAPRLPGPIGLRAALSQPPAARESEQ